MWPLSQQKVAAEWSAFLHIGAGRLVTRPGWRFAASFLYMCRGAMEPSQPVVRQKEQMPRLALNLHRKRTCQRQRGQSGKRRGQERGGLWGISREATFYSAT